MYDELVKRLRASVDGRYEKCDVCPYEEDYPCCVDCLDKMHKQAADAIEELSEQFENMNEANIALYGALPKWIPVTERLPEPNAVDERGFAKAYLVKTDRHVMMHTARWDGMYWILWGKSTTLTDKVTHWMPLPEPPKEET